MKQQPVSCSEPNYNYTMQQWYPLLTHCTIPSIFIPLGREEVECIVVAYGVIYAQYFRWLSQRRKGPEQGEFWGNGNWMFQDEVEKELKQKQLLHVRDQLLLKLKSKVPQPKPYFCKLSLRSPKDSLALHKYRQKVQKNYTQQQQIQLHSEIERLSLRVWTCEQMLEMLCSSQRIRDDLRRLGKESKYQVEVVVRDWTTIPACLELRVFMRGGKLTAISSYYKSQRHPWLLKHKQPIATAINNFYESEIHPALPYKQAVFDMGIQLPDKQFYTTKQIDQILKTSNWKVILIEINPFGKMTGPALFSWEVDKQVLMDGDLVVRFSGEEDL